MPSLLSGAAFGRLVGQLVQEPFGLVFDDNGSTSNPGFYALIGATAMLAGMARITLSLAVILMEASGVVDFALPIFVTTLFSKWTGDMFNLGIYDVHIELKHVPLLEAKPSKELFNLTAKNVMTQNVTTFKEVESVRDIFHVLGSCRHHGFAVVKDDLFFTGLIKKETLLQVLWRGKAYDVFQHPSTDLRDPAPFVPFNVERTQRSIPDIVKTLEPEDYDKLVDLRPYVNEGCYRVNEDTVLSRVYKLFRSMGLRHLPVVTRTGRLRGLITRKDLILAEGHSGGRVSRANSEIK